MASIDTITDKTSTVPANSEQKPEDASGLPEEILALPIFNGILQGSPAALYTKTGDKSIEATTAVKHQKALAEVGIFLYRDKPSGLDLIFNGQYVSKELLDAAAKKGKLESVASPLAETVAEFGGSPGVTPAEGSGGAAPAMVGPSGGLPESPANTARLNNMESGSPTSGLAGQGRVLNSLVKPTI